MANSPLLDEIIGIFLNDAKARPYKDLAPAAADMVEYANDNAIFPKAYYYREELIAWQTRTPAPRVPGPSEAEIKALKALFASARENRQFRGFLIDDVILVPICLQDSNIHTMFLLLTFVFTV